MVSRAYFSYCQLYARFPEYLMLGEALRPPDVDCAIIEIPLAGTVQGRPTSRPPQKTPGARFPAVNVGGFRAADGSVATVLANTTEKPQIAKLSVAIAVSNPTLYDAQRRELQQWNSVPAGQAVRIELEPFGTRILIDG
ncbi:MAG TPA: hypothetical protein VLM89_06595 [Phycisphaerae bacterium]|nr:hypothetical protein [Phycisphaerae bacterium]